MIFFCGIPIPNNWISPLTVGRRVAQGKFSAAETFDTFWSGKSISPLHELYKEKYKEI